MSLGDPEFYHPLPLTGIKMSDQWPKFRDNFHSLASIVRAATVDGSTTQGEDDLAGWALGELDFRNRFRTFYDKSDEQFKIQVNNGTEGAPIWQDYFTIRKSDGRVGIPSGIDPNPFYGLTLTETGQPNTTKLKNKSVVRFDDTFFYLSASSGDGQPIVSIDLSGFPASSGEANTASNLGSGEGVFSSKSSVDLQFKSLIAGTGVGLSSSSTDITISAPDKFYGSTVKQSDDAASFSGIKVFSFESASFYVTQNSTNTDEAQINFRGSASGGGETNTASNLGTGEGVFSSKSGVDLQFKSIVAGDSIALSSDSNEITVSSTARQFYGLLVKESESGGYQERDDAIIFDSTWFYIVSDGSGKPIVSIVSSSLPGAGGGETNTASNLGTGEGVFSTKSGVDLQFKSLVASGGIRLSSDANEITISQNQFYISDAQDVAKTSPTNNQVLAYNTATGLWEPADQAGGGNVTVKETESGGYSKSTATIAFDSTTFYLESGGDGNPIVGLVGHTVAFAATKGETNQAATGADDTITWSATEFDLGGDFDLNNNQFVAPSNGIYSLHLHVGTTASSVANDNMAIRINVNGTTVANGRFTPHANGDIVNIEISKVIYLTSGDTVTAIDNFNSSVTISGNAVNTFFTGFKLL